VADYTIVAGDSLSVIAAEFATSAAAIAVLNDVRGAELFIGSALRIPVGFDVDLSGAGPPIDEPLVLLRNWPSLLEYHVAQGDVLSFIADEFGTTPEAVALYNGLAGNVVVLGQTLIVPLNFEVPLPELEPVVMEMLRQDGAGGVGRVDDDDLAALLVGVPDDPVIALRLWRDRTTYTTQAGDSLFAIASDFQTSVDAIRVLNGLLPGALLQIGVPLEVPVGFQRVFDANP
jgi:LysM repeat protein